MPAFPFNEKHLSQLPAVVELTQLGYTYLPAEKALKERGGKFANVLLEKILHKQLKKINRICWQGDTHAFSKENIRAAITKIKNIRYRGFLNANEEIYDLLTLGTVMEQSIAGNSRSFTLNYIDWHTPANNVFHVVAEFAVERTNGQQTARPDIVLFVNGIPFAVMECKAPSVDVGEGISQTIRNQKDEYIPRLFMYAQLLLAVNKNAARYATVGTNAEFWSRWREMEYTDADVEQVVNRNLDDKTKNALFSGEFAGAHQQFATQHPRQVTEQDRVIHALCKPERLLEIAQRFTLFDGGERKIARYQQYFVVRSTLQRVKQIENSGTRAGGMIWHTQGSGKSLTMVWIARLLATHRDITNARIIMATDRKNLDKQIEQVFRQCGIAPKRADSGRELMELIQSKVPVITTLVHKFDTAVGAKRVTDNDANIFVLVDESHRTQFGSLAARMRQMLPKACYIGFTGTPLTREQKNNFAKFGALIEPSYSVRQALKDKAIVPLLYEGRHVDVRQDKEAVDVWFERYTSGLNKKQKADLKKKYARANTINKAERVVYMRAFDISAHYRDNWKNTGFKAQLAAPDKATAIKLHQFMEELGDVSSKVIISAPDMREGYEEVGEKPISSVVQFWQTIMSRFGSESEYDKTVIDSFKNGEKPEMLIVVDKLLTGFDAPVNTVLYISKKMKEHTLLQAIARVNRLHEGKDFGYIVDYEGILGELDEALTKYDALAGYEPDELEQILVSVNEEVKKLPQRHSDLWDIFKGIANHNDEEEYEVLLGDEQRRHEFYDALSAYSKTLAIALSSHAFWRDTDDATLRNYKNDLKRFEKLRLSVKLRYADAVDYTEHEPSIRKLLDTHIQADTVTKVVGPVPVVRDLNNAQSGLSEAARADGMAHRMKRTINENMEKDPAFYEKFSTLIQQAIDDFRAKRLSGSQYLKTVKKIKEAFDKRVSDDVPEKLHDNADAVAFFGVILPVLKVAGCDVGQCDEVSADIALAIHRILQEHHKVLFWDDTDAKNETENDIDDYLCDEVRDKRGIALDEKQMHEIIKRTMNVACSRSCR